MNIGIDIKTLCERGFWNSGFMKTWKFTVCTCCGGAMRVENFSKPMWVCEDCGSMREL